MFKLYHIGLQLASEGFSNHNILCGKSISFRPIGCAIDVEPIRRQKIDLHYAIGTYFSSFRCFMVNPNFNKAIR